MDSIEWLDIELTSFCNIECKGCFRVISAHADKILNKHYITLDTIRERFQRSMFPNIKIINFCGSVDEPTSHPQFHQIIEHFAQWDVYINIATNGSIRTTQWWEKLAGIWPKDHHVTWGIDGSDELSEVYRKGSSYRKVQQNYRAFNSAGGRSIWQFIVFEHNEHQLEEARAVAKAEGFQQLKTIISHRKDTQGGVKDAVPDSHKSKPNPVDKIKEIPYVSCKYGNQKRIFINHTGNVIPCCHLNSKMMEYEATGIVKDQFEQLLLDNQYRDSINLNSVDIEQAINSDVWKGITDSWSTDTPVPRCMQVCKQMKQDKFIKEEL